MIQDKIRVCPFSVRPQKRWIICIIYRLYILKLKQLVYHLN